MTQQDREDAVMALVNRQLEAMQEMTEEEFWPHIAYQLVRYKFAPMDEDELEKAFEEEFS